MSRMKFDKNGNLHENQTLSYGEFEKEFGFNESRKEKIKNVLLFLQIFSSFGCTNTYIAGSFVSNKEFPNDIDLCIDITGIDYLKLSKVYPEFLNQHGIEKIKKEHKVHLIFFDADSLGYLDWFRKDRNNNPRGLVKIYLHDTEDYDQKRKAT